MEPDQFRGEREADRSLALGYGALMGKSRLIETLMDCSDQKRGPKTCCVCCCTHGGRRVALWLFAPVPRRVGLEGSCLQREHGQPGPHACDPPICVHPE